LIGGKLDLHPFQKDSSKVEASPTFCFLSPGGGWGKGGPSEEPPRIESVRLEELSSTTTTSCRSKEE